MMFLSAWQDRGRKDYISGVRLWQRGQYDEAETLLRQAARKHAKHGHEYPEEKLCIKHYLGRALYDLDKFSEAEELLIDAAGGRQLLLGKEHEDTLWSKHWLGRTLYNQKKYNEAIAPLQWAKDGREKAFGPNQSDTLESKLWLDRSIKHIRKAEHQQKDYLGDENEQNGSQEDEHKPGNEQENDSSIENEGDHENQEDETSTESEGDHENIRSDSEALLQDQTHNMQVHPTIVLTEHAVEKRLASFFSDGQGRHTAYTDSEINQISSLLEHYNPRWSKVPRTYIVLRTIGYLHLLNDLIDAEFSDYWFPVTARTLPGYLLPSVKTSFVQTQHMVLTKSMDLEKGDDGQHLYYGLEEFIPFETKGVLGRGGYGQVDRVLSLISFKEYARKKVLRGVAFRGRQKEDVMRFIKEIELLKRLKHRHIVEFVGSYTDSRYIALIMSPVAEMDLGAYLARVTVSNYPEMRTFFGCLATGLEFLHEQNVRHKDIKPANILISHGYVLFTDFGLSLDFTDADGSTTTGMANGMTVRYCAPEVACGGPRNTMSDIWSLGAVFMEIIAVLKGKTAQHLNELYKQHGSWQAFVVTSPSALSEFVAELEKIGDLADNKALEWAQKMLSPNQKSRPPASLLIEYITTSSKEGGSVFCGICCDSSEDDNFHQGDNGCT
tara:strand:+ start:20808 stop:22802 length:1995 start_codon:yes stop_codon:yes gene_type:complete